MGNAYSTGIFSNLNAKLDARFPPQRILEDSHIKIEGLKTKRTLRKVPGIAD